MKRSDVNTVTDPDTVDEAEARDESRFVRIKLRGECNNKRSVNTLY